MSFRPYAHALAPHRGLLDVGCAAFGGLVFDSVSGRLLPRDNPHLFFEDGDELVARSHRPPMFALSVRTDGVQLDWNLFPGITKVDVEANRLRRRNLIAAQSNNNADPFRLFAVDPGSTRRKVIVRALEWVEDDVVPSKSLDSKTFELETPCLQLECWSGAPDSVVARTENSVCLISDVYNDGSMSTVFQDEAIMMTFNPYLKLEMAVVDKNGQLWWGEMREGLGRRKTDGDGSAKEIVDVTWSDHPRLLYVADRRRIGTLDLRAPPVVDAKELFVLPYYDALDDIEAISFNVSGLFPIEEIRLITPLIGSRRHLLVATDRRLILIDERMPNCPLLSTGHSMFEGPDVLLSAPGCTHDKGTTLPVLAFKHEAWNEVLNWSLLRYANSDQFSSVGPPHRIADPSAAFDHCVYHSPTFPTNPKVMERVKWPTRGLSVVRRSTDAVCLLRLLENGDVWCDSLKLGAQCDDDQLTAYVRKTIALAELFSDEKGPTEAVNMPEKWDIDAYDLQPLSCSSVRFGGAFLSNTGEEATMQDETCDVCAAADDPEERAGNLEVAEPQPFDINAVPPDCQLSHIVLNSMKLFE